MKYKRKTWLVYYNIVVLHNLLTPESMCCWFPSNVTLFRFAWVSIFSASSFSSQTKMISMPSSVCVCVRLIGAIYDSNRHIFHPKWMVLLRLYNAYVHIIIWVKLYSKKKESILYTDRWMVALYVEYLFELIQHWPPLWNHHPGSGIPSVGLCVSFFIFDSFS